LGWWHILQLADDEMIEHWLCSVSHIYEASLYGSFLHLDFDGMEWHPAAHSIALKAKAIVCSCSTFYKI